MSIRKVAVIFDNQARPDTTGVYCRRALGQLVEVEHFLPTDLSRLPRRGFDLYLNIDDGLEYRFPADLRPCAFWAIDTHLQWDWYATKAPDFDHVFAAQRDGAFRLRRAGLVADWLPLACDPDIHRKHDLPKAYDVCFVGHIFPGPRADLLERIRRRFPRHFIGQRFFEEMARTYSESRIVFNRSLRNDVNMRVFEALACGSLLLTNDLAENGQDELFRPGEHLAVYRDANELTDQIAFYLRHEDLREKIAAAGRAAVLERDTYRHRMAKLLEVVERRLGRTISAVAGPEAETSAAAPGASALLSAAAGEPLAPEDAAVLARVPPSARRVLHLGCGTGGLGRALKARGAVEVCGVETREETALQAQRHLDMVLAADPEATDLASFGPCDAVVCGDVLTQACDPRDLLRRLRPQLTPEGRLLAVLPNLRQHSLVRSLLEGHWTCDAAGAPLEGRPQLFTRREIEKLFDRAGWTITALEAIPGPDHEEWRRQGRPGHLWLGNLHLGGLDPAEAEEFFAASFLIEAVPAETSDPGLTSLVILTHNQLEYTRRCLDSVRRFTDEPHELIVVDNASSDGTVEYLRSLPDVRLIANADNRGFPAAANQGIRAASGRQILLLNNDTVVTTGWLKRLLRALHSEPTIGLVGPCSNCVSGEQQVAVGYDDLAGFDGFAWDWGKRHDGRRSDTDRLIGFCLLIRREVVDRIGLLDERFGLGCFEDDDYCLQALQAGWRAVIAWDAFVHHYGGRTFVGSGVDFAALMEENQRRFRTKWEEEKPASPPSAPARTAYALHGSAEGGLILTRCAPRLSLCMIVRDSARTLGACLESIRPWVDEMIVVDTGSKDDTKEIAARFGAKVFDFPWVDSFAAARNESLKHATGEWVFWMDSDDVIDADNGRKLRELVRREPHDPNVLGYVMQVHCPGPGEDGRTDVTAVDHIKLVRNRPDIRFEGRIHEQILPFIRRAGGEVAWTDVFVVHSGYDHSPAGQERKRQRDLHLLHLELEEQPDHPFTLFNLGMTYADVGEYEKGAEFLRRSIRCSGTTESHLRKAYALLVYSCDRLGRSQEAWEACEQGLHLFPEDVELRFRRGILLHAAGRLQEAILAYEDVLRPAPDRYFSSIDRGLRGFKARQNLAAVYLDLGDLERAEEQWRRIVEEEPRYRLGWRGLTDLLLRRGKTEEALALAEKLRNDERLRDEGWLIEAQAAAARGDVPAARRAFRKALERRPDDADFLQAHCRFLFEQGEPEEAEKALKQLLACEPDDAAAHHNLGALYLRSDRPEEAAEACRQSLRLRPEAAHTWKQLGQALERCGRREEAARTWEEVLRLAPSDAEASAALAESRRTENPSSLQTRKGLEQISVACRLRDRTMEARFAVRGAVDRAILREVWERDVYGVRDVPRPPRTVLDVGAHLGGFAVLAAESWPKARILAGEADPDNVALLRQNLEGRPNAEVVAAAIVGEEREAVDFYQVRDKVGMNSGGGSCCRADPGSAVVRVPAISVVALWREKQIDRCDFLKLDCEGAELLILKALAEAGLLGRVSSIAGEWHVVDDRQTPESVRAELRDLLQATHEVNFQPDRGGREGYFSARIRKNR